MARTVVSLLLTLGLASSPRAVTNPEALDAREPAAIDATVLGGPHRDPLPRDRQLVGFPAAAPR